METFIHQQFLSDISICDAIIDLHKKSNQKRYGGYTLPSGYVVDKDVKDSIDVILPKCEVGFKYTNLLREVVAAYIHKFPMCDEYSSWGMYEDVNIQYYPPGGGYKKFHCERGDSIPPASTRHLVFMTYLNDVTDEGGTEFFHQKLITKPKKGLTLIWPADWTHTHKGVVSPTQEKYIITGWFNYSPQKVV